MCWYRAEESGKCYWQRSLCLPSSIWSPLGSPGQNWLWLPVWFYFCLWTCCPPAQHSMVWRTTEAPTELSKVLHSPRDLGLLSSWRWLWLFWRPADRTVSASGKWGGFNIRALNVYQWMVNGSPAEVNHYFLGLGAAEMKGGLCAPADSVNTDGSPLAVIRQCCAILQDYCSTKAIA